MWVLSEFKSLGLKSEAQGKDDKGKIFLKNVKTGVQNVIIQEHAEMVWGKQALKPDLRVGKDVLMLKPVPEMI